MYAIVEIAGKQFKIIKKQELYVPKLAGNVGEIIFFDKVLMFWREDQSNEVGVSTLPGMKVGAKILIHEKGDKVIVFKKKRRKGYKVKRGHRQDYTKIVIEDIVNVN